jgi:hypothetical protein
MSDEPISVPESVDPAVLERAGWSNAELIWEQIQETAAGCRAAGDIEEAEELWQGALEVAREYFADNDPRLAASLVNAALIHRRAGREAQAQILLAEALLVWKAADAWIAMLKPDVRARSSTFHLRMQRKHLGGYEHFAQKRYVRLAVAGVTAIYAQPRCARSAGTEDDSGAAERRTHWHSVKPAQFNDNRKLLGAVWLMTGPVKQDV